MAYVIPAIFYVLQFPLDKAPVVVKYVYVIDGQTAAPPVPDPILI